MHPFTLLAALAITPFSFASPLQTRDPPCNDECKTDILLFNTPMAQFLEAKRKGEPSSLEWADDGCSVPLVNGSGLDFLVDFPEGFNFLDSCRRHDFGYYNYRKQNRCNEDTRGQIDLNFLKDLEDECKQYSGFFQTVKRIDCRQMALTYFTAVRSGGSCEGPLKPEKRDLGEQKE